MVAIAPFRAIRYNPSKVSNLSLVVSPPYDVIGVLDYDKLLKRHPQNVVRIELPLAHRKEDRYGVAARLWKRWQSQRFLTQDKEPSFYGYEQRFTVGNQLHTRRGFFAALRLEAPGKGPVRPHERTFSKHKEDRLLLMRATHANISPIFGIFFDQQKKAQSLLQKRMIEKPLALCRDDKGVTHRLWRWTDPDARKILTDVLRQEEVLIADGHHRYETAWNYASERARQDRASYTRDRAYRFVMAFLCPLDDPGLVIQPTHRSVRYPRSWDEWQSKMESCFSVQRVPSLATLVSRLRSARTAALGAVVEGGGLFWLKAKGPYAASLPVVPLHERILKDVPPENISYGQDPRDMVVNLQRGEANIVFLLPPPDKETFARICRAGRLLPQKSTYFFPKVVTGMVMRSLDGGV